MEKQVLDYVLVPSGLMILVAYHIWLLHRIIKQPNKTVIGVNAMMGSSYDGGTFKKKIFNLLIL